MKPARRIVLVTLTAAFANLPLSFPAPAQSPGPAAPLRSEGVTGTVFRVDPESRMVVVLTGVGHAIRTRSVHIPPELLVRARGAGVAAMPVIGSVVRIEFSGAAGSNAASVELIQTPPAARKP